MKPHCTKRFDIKSKFTMLKSAFVIFLMTQTNFQSVAQSLATQVDVTGTNTTNTITNNTATFIDPGLSVVANGSINGFIVTITDSYTTGDMLSYTGSLPAGITAAAFNTTTRSLVFSGTTSAANWQDLMRRIRLQTTSATCFPEIRKVSFIAGDAYYSPLNGHFYKYRATSESWTTARAYAETQSYFGQLGYLATISSQAENSFISILIGQNSWIGCSDNSSIVNGAVGYTKYASQTNAEGKFHWVTGPEKGTQLRAGNAVSPAVGAVIAGVYQNWAASEPNDWPTSDVTTLSQEDYGHMYSGAGNWNDFPNSMAIGSVIEFGGMPNDLLNSQIVFTRNLYINGAPSGTINGGNATVCAGGSATLTLSGLSGSVVRWESSLDNFLTAGTTIVNTTATLNLTNIQETRYYRAIVNSTSGCSSLATSATPVYVSTTIAGNIQATNNTICPGSQASFTLFGNAGSVVKWQVSTSSTFASAVTDILVTSTSMNYTLASAGTYYFRALVQNNGCTSLYSNTYTITVSSGTAPVGGSVSSAEHCGGTNSGTLNLTGHTGTIQKWQYSVDGGVIWIDIANTAASYAYSGVANNRLFRAVITNGACGFTYSNQGSVTVYGTTVCKWLGTTSTDWGTASNWCGGIGDNGLDVVVSSTAPNDLVLDQNRIIGNFNFNGANRIVILGNNSLTANTFSGFNSVRFVKTNGNGKLKMNVNNNGSLLFPVANSAYNPVTIGNNSGNSDYFSVGVLDEVYVNGYSGAAFTTPRVKRTWDITKTNANASSGINFIFNWNANEIVNITNPALFHYNGSTWDRQTGTTSYTSNSLTYTGYVGTFSPFAITNYETPLPVLLSSFSASCNDDESVSLKWQTASEMNSDYFVVQRSLNGKDWESLEELNAAMVSNTPTDYVYQDYSGIRGIRYYQLIQKDMDGKETVYGPLSVICNLEETEVFLYPNPTKNKFSIIVESNKVQEFMLRFETADGRILQERLVKMTEGANLITMDAQNLPSGSYSVSLVNDENSYFRKVILQ